MNIYKEILTALESTEQVVLATVISTSGSTPASAFSKMLLKNETSWVGTVGGGCMEGDVLEAALKVFGGTHARIMTFHLNEDDIPQGLICGGSLDVLIEPITRDSLGLMRSLAERVDSGIDSIVTTVLDKDNELAARLLIPKEHDLGPLTDHLVKFMRIETGFPDTLMREIHASFSRSETRRIHEQGYQILLEPVAGRPPLIIFGGGHVSKYISRIAVMSGFVVTVVDDRSEYANAIRFPEASSLLAMDFAEAFNHIQITPSTFIVIVTRGHRFDEEILERALETPARYVGMIGSTRKVYRTYERLVERGIDPAKLEKVHAPVGLDIAAVTAEEIAVSIVAQLISIRRSGKGGDKSSVMRPLLGNLTDKR